MAFERAQEFFFKRRRRNMEYIGLIAFQGYFATRFFAIVDFLPACVSMLSVGSLAWVLGGHREQRRTEAFLSRPRLLADAVESLLLLFVLMLTGLVSILLNMNLLRYQSYVSIALLAFFIASFVREMVWQKRKFPLLDETRKNNYVMNLNKSIIFPYNLKYLRRVFSSRNKKQ